MTARAEALALVRRLPRIDLHLHLEGSIPPEVLRAIATRHRVTVPRLRFRGFEGFLKAFGSAADLLRDEEDFRLAAAAVIARARRRGLLHLEILFSPQVAMRRGVPVASIMEGLLRARRAATPGGPSVVFIADGVRQWGAGWFEETLHALRPWAGRGLDGAGMGGDETALPARDFAKAYSMARRMGLRTTVHAGEAGGAGGVAEALRWLTPDRVGHGIAVIEDAALTRRVARRGTALECCPTSNRTTGIVAPREDHPLRDLLAAGVKVTINSDDGTFFRTDVVRELHRAVRTMGLTADEVIRVVRNAARASFLPARRRARLERRVLSAAGRSS